MNIVSMLGEYSVYRQRIVMTAYDGAPLRVQKLGSSGSTRIE